MKNLSLLVLIIIFPLILPIDGTSKDSELTSSGEVVGTFEDQAPTWYAIIKTDNERSKLYMAGDLIYSRDNFLDAFSILNISNGIMILKDKNGETLVLTPGERIPVEGSDKVFVKTIEASVLEYSYIPPSQASSRQELEDFTLKNLVNKRVSLEKRYKKGLFSDMPMTQEERSLFDSPKAENIEQPHLIADLFLNIGINKTGENVWEIDGESAKGAVQNAEKVLFSIIRSVEPKFRFGEGPNLNFKCELGDATLNNEGFIIRNLAIAKLGERMGIQQGDIIKSINGCPINSLFGIYEVYKSISTDSSVTEVNVDIIRDKRMKRLSYRIR